MEGGTLSEAAERGALGAPNIAFILKEVLIGLAYIHSLLVVHRDIKASNVMLSVAAEVKISTHSAFSHRSSWLTKCS